MVDDFDDEITLDARRSERRTPPPPSLAPTSLARTMRTVPERPRPRATSAIVVGLLVSAASAATVLGLGHRAPSPYPPVTPSVMTVTRYTVSASQPAPPLADDAITAVVAAPDAGHVEALLP